MCGAYYNGFLCCIEIFCKFNDIWYRFEILLICLDKRVQEYFSLVKSFEFLYDSYLSFRTEIDIDARKWENFAETFPFGGSLYQIVTFFLISWTELFAVSFLFATKISLLQNRKFCELKMQGKNFQGLQFQNEDKDNIFTGFLIKINFKD